MNKIVSRICAAAAMAVAFSALPAQAASPSYGGAEYQTVQFSFGFGVGNERDRRDRFERRGNYHYYNGHRGYRDRRAGFRYYNGFWFPQSAFSFGFSIGSDRNDGYRRGARLSSRHIEWCQSQYRSYRVSDNSFQPYNGPRRECISPYTP